LCESRHMKHNQARQADRQVKEVSSRQMQVREADAATIARYCQPRSGTPAAKPPPFAVDRPMVDGMARMGLQQQRGGAQQAQPAGASRPVTPSVFESSSPKRKAKISVADVFPDDGAMPDVDGGGPVAGGAPPTSVLQPAGSGAPKAGRRMLAPFPGDGPQFGQLGPHDATAPPSRGRGSVPVAPSAGVPMTMVPPAPHGGMMMPMHPHGVPQVPTPTPFGMQPASKMPHGLPPHGVPQVPPSYQPSFAAKFAAANATHAAGARTGSRSGSNIIFG